MRKFITNKITLYTFGIILFVLLWEIISLIINEPIMIFPDPITTTMLAFEYLGDAYTWRCIGATLSKMLIGFLVSFGMAIIFGTLAGNNMHLKKIFDPTIIALKAVPTAATVFVFLVIAGFKNAPIYIVVLIAFPILYESVVGGFQNISKEINDSLKLDDKSYFSKIMQVKLPLAFPYIVVGLASSFALAFKVEIMAEIMAGSNDYGIGSAIQVQRQINSSDMRPVFAYSLIIIVMVLLTTLISSLLKKKFSK